MGCSRLTERDVVAAWEPESRREQDDWVSLTGYLASIDLEHELRDEVAAAGRRASQHPHGRLVVSADEPLPSVWAANVWRNVEQIPITSIGHAAKELRDRQRNWALYAGDLGSASRSLGRAHRPRPDRWNRAAGRAVRRLGTAGRRCWRRRVPSLTALSLLTTHGQEIAPGTRPGEPCL